jgi:hypothetical protein
MEFLCCNNILKTSDNASSARNEGSAGLGGRICAVVTSQKNLSHNHTFQYIQMVNAPAGGQPGVATGQVFGFVVGLCIGLFN